MPRFTKRAAIIGALVALAGTLASVSGAPAASGQEAGGPVPVEMLAGGPATAAPTTAQVSPGSAGTQQLTESGLAPEATVTQGHGGGEPMGAESVIGADGRVQVVGSATQNYPASAIGQIEFTDFDGGSFICTGWLIDRNSILTSGHCSFNPSPAGNHIIQSAQFFPGRSSCDQNFQNCVNPFGGCNVTSAFALSGWRISGRAKDDWSIQQLDCNIGNTVGWLGYFSVPGVDQLDGKTARVEGYPGDKPPGTHWKMSGTIASRTNANNVFYPMDTAGGQSGSPIMVANRPSCGGPCGMGIHSYGAGGNPPLNSGPRITGTNFTTIQDIADNNGV